MSLRTDVFPIDCEFHDHEMNLSIEFSFENSSINHWFVDDLLGGFRPYRHHRHRHRHRVANDFDDDAYLNSNLDEEVHHSYRFLRMKTKESSVELNEEYYWSEQTDLFHLNVDRLNPI